MSNNVLNCFEHPTSDGDNVLRVGGSILSPGGQSLKDEYIREVLDFTAAGGRGFVVPGFAGTIVEIQAVLNGLDATANTIIDFKIGAAGPVITGGTITIANLDTVGTTYTAIPTAQNVITATDVLEVIVVGGGYAGGKIEMTLRVNMS